MLLARRPRPLGGRISEERGDGDLLGERGHGMVEMCSTAGYRLFLLLFEVWWVAEVVVAEVEVEVEVVRMRGRPLRLPPPVRKWNLETMVETRLRMDMDMEDCELDEIVEGECLRRGLGEPASLRASRVGRGATRGKAVRIKEGGIIAVCARERERVRSRPRACQGCRVGSKKEKRADKEQVKMARRRVLVYVISNKRSRSIGCERPDHLRFALVSRDLSVGITHNNVQCGECGGGDGGGAPRAG